jgi:GNAT superfamily N-acetyltransferase
VVKNIVEDQAAQFGTHPWWFYPDALVQRSYGPWGLLFLAAALVAVVRQWRQPLVWGVWLFVLGHTAVGHKEFRFLWPLVPFTALLVVLAWQGLGEATRLRLTTWARSRVARALGIVVLAANGGMLLATSLMPAKSDVWVLQAVYDTWGGGQPICIIEGSADQLFRRNNYHEYTFYRSRGFVWVSPDSMAQRVATGQALPQPLLLTVNRKGLAPPDTSLGWCHCHLAVQYFPPWMSHLNVNGWLDRTAQYVIYQCEP